MASENRVVNPHWEGDGTYEDRETFFKVPVNALNIIWGNDPRYWRLNYSIRDENCLFDGFKEGALLVQVNWLEVTGKLPMKLFKSASAKKYEIHYVVKFRVDAFGWHSAPIKFKVRVDPEETETIINLESYREKHDEWHEIPGGQFSVSDSAEYVEFGMYEVESAWWKGGMILAGIKIKAIKDQFHNNEFEIVGLN